MDPETESNPNPNPELETGGNSASGSSEPLVTGDGAGGNPSGEAGDPAAPPTEPARDWRDRELVRVRGQRQNLREENEELKRQLAALQQPINTNTNPTNPTNPILDPTADFNRRVEAAAQSRAQQIALEQDFVRRCNETATAGQTAFPETWQARIGALNNSVDKNDPVQAQAWNNFLSAAIETGEGTKVLHELGGNVNEAARIMALPPVKMAVELAKLATGVTEVSQVGRPITPVTRTRENRSPINPDDPDRADNLSTADWMRRREEQVANARRAAAGR